MAFCNTVGLEAKPRTNAFPRSNQDIINQAQVEITDRRLFDLDRQQNDRQRQICENGPLDKRMGISGKREACETCNEPLLTCNGHFGHVKLVLPIFHVGYFKKIIQILQCICKAREIQSTCHGLALTSPGMLLYSLVRSRPPKIPT